MKTIQEVSKETLQIENFISTKEEGSFLTYAEIEKESGVIMDNRGKSFLRTALKRCGHEYLCMKGEGIELASPDSAMTITAHRLVKIDNTVKKSKKTTRNLHNKFADRMEETASKQISFVVAFFALIETQSANMKRMIKGRTDISNYKLPELPQS